MFTRRSSVRLAGVADFVDTAYLRNQRPKVPGGAWQVQHLRGKSIADLQQIWFTLVRERNMLQSMKDHYIRHTEELGAMPAPSRIKMVDESMANIRKVMFERDAQAADEAEKIFKQRIAKGIYRYPAGPQPATGARKSTVSVVKVTLSGHLEEARLRELLGRFDVFDNHRGIAELTLELSPEAAEQKQTAEDAFDQWYWASDDVREYARVSDSPSFFDECVAVELAPGEYLEETIAAGKLEVPPTKEDKPPGSTPLERIQHANRSYTERQVLQLGYFPNLTAPAPTDPGARPTHPDEIEGPFVCTIVYGLPGGKEYLDSLELTTIDGVKVLGIEDATAAYLDAHPQAADTAEYREAIGQEMANVAHLKMWPIIPKWKDEYRKLARAKDGEIVHYNYTNVVDYVDREALLTNKTVWECPVTIDPSAGRSDQIPPHAEPPVQFIPNAPYAREEY